MEAAGSAVSQRHQRPRGSGRGKGDRWRTDRWEAKQGSGETHACACQGLVAPAAPAGEQLPLPTPCQPHGCTSQPWRCSHSTLDTPPGPGSQLVPGSPGSDVRTPWDWHGPLALFAGDGKLEKQILQQASQVEEASMACRKRSCSILATSVHSHFVEFPVLLSCLLSKGQARESGANRVNVRCPAVGAHGIWADISPCHGTPVWGHSGNVHIATGAAAGAATSSLHPPLSNKRKLFSTPQFLGEIYGPSGSRGPGLLSVSACRASSRHTASFMRHMQLCRAGVSLRSPPLIQHPQPTRLFLPSGSCGNVEAAVNCSLSDAGTASSCHTKTRPCPPLPAHFCPGGTASVQGGAWLMGQKCPAAVPVPVLLTHGVLSESVAFPLSGWRLST